MGGRNHIKPEGSKRDVCVLEKQWNTRVDENENQYNSGKNNKTHLGMYKKGWEKKHWLCHLEKKNWSKWQFGLGDPQYTETLKIGMEINWWTWCN